MTKITLSGAFTFVFFLLFVLLNFSESANAQACQASCGKGTDIEVNLQARCMCLKGGEFFKIDIGTAGPWMTTGGTGKMKRADGAKYQTKDGEGNTNYDNDAIATGISANDEAGKWIHKTRTRTTTGRAATKGCIAVPWEKWPLVKAAAGLNKPGAKEGTQISICGGGRIDTGRGSGGGSGGGSSSGRRQIR